MSGRRTLGRAMALKEAARQARRPVTYGWYVSKKFHVARARSCIVGLEMCHSSHTGR
ncbi:MAG: hypothetical protein N2204_04405 [Anaerolineae bacterium]|nr:hypothetical protein [Anaerolineae bacterium]